MILLLGCILLLFSAPLSMICSSILICKSSGKFKQYLFFYIFVFFILAYSCMPNYENDLIRYFNMINECKDIPFSGAFTWGNDGLVVNNFIFWIISRCGDVHLLPAMTAAVFYGISAYIAADQIEGRNKHLETIIVFQLLTLPFFEGISNVRNVSAFSLIILAVYRDIVKKKRNIITALLYILPCFVHMSGFVMLLVRIAVPLFKKHTFGFSMCALGVPSLTFWIYNNYRTLIYSISGNIGLILSRAINKAYSVTMQTSQYAQTMAQSGYIKTCRAVNMIILICIMILTLKYIAVMKKAGFDEKVNYALFVLIICDITAVWCALGIIKYWVFMFAVVIACSPILLYYINSFRSGKRLPRICLFAIQLGAVLRFALELYFISTRIVVPDLFQGIILNNAFSIFWRVVAGA